MKLLFILLLFSCGKDNHSGNKPCKSRQQKVIECINQMTPLYGRQYAYQACHETYRLEGCYE